jgi:hypothetical protein
VKTRRRDTGSGLVAEAVLAAVFRSNRLPFDRQPIVGQSIYGTAWHADFVLYGLALFPDGLIVESKWQNGDGSVDEKFPYLALNLQHGPLPGVAVIMGPGFRDGAIRWLAAQTIGQFKQVFSLEEFMSWIQRQERRSNEYATSDCAIRP